MVLRLTSQQGPWWDGKLPSKCQCCLIFFETRRLFLWHLVWKKSCQSRIWAPERHLHRHGSGSRSPSEIGKLTFAVRHLFFTIRDKRWKAKHHPRRNRKVMVGNSNNVTSEIWKGMVPDYNKVMMKTENNLERPSVWVRKHPYYCDCNSSVQALTLCFTSFLFTSRLCWHFVCWNALKLGNSKIWAGRSFTACRIGQSRPPFFVWKSVLRKNFRVFHRGRVCWTSTTCAREKHLRCVPWFACPNLYEFVNLDFGQVASWHSEEVFPFSGNHYVKFYWGTEDLRSVVKW